MATLIQLFVLAVWLVPMLMHVQRLFRLAHVRHNQHDLALRRIRWWLGRPEFWHRVQHDALRSTETTLAVIALIGLRG